MRLCCICGKERTYTIYAGIGGSRDRETWDLCEEHFNLLRWGLLHSLNLREDRLAEEECLKHFDKALEMLKGVRSRAAEARVLLDNGWATTEEFILRWKKKGGTP